jgi:long-chain fatty acid transport protein
MRRPPRAILSVLVVIGYGSGFAGGSVGTAEAQAADTFGFGARSASLAGAVTADVRDGSANYYNPAGLAAPRDVVIDLGYFRAFGDFEINGYDSGIDPISGLTVAAIVPGRIGDFGFAFGVGVHLPDGRVSRSRTLPRQQPRWEFYDNRPHRALLSANLAIRPFDWLRIGGGISFQARSDNDLRLRGGIDATSPDTETRLEHEIVATLSTIRYPQVGVQVDPHPRVSVGLVYRHQVAIGNDLAASVDGAITGFGTPIDAILALETAAINVYVPRQVSLGVSVRPFDFLWVGAELTWVDWSDYQSAIGASDVTLRIDVPPELESLIDVPDSIASTRFIDAELRDRFVPRFGVEAVPFESDAVRVTGRIGYLYENTPVPEQRALTNLIDNDRHAFSLGAGVALTDLEPTLPGTLSLDVHVQYSVLPERLTRKSSLVDAIGDYRARGEVWNGAVTLGVAFE